MTKPPTAAEPRQVTLATLLEKFERAAEFPSYRIQSADLEIIVATLRTAVEERQQA